MINETLIKLKQKKIIWYKICAYLDKHPTEQFYPLTCGYCNNFKNNDHLCILNYYPTLNKNEKADYLMGFCSYDCFINYKEKISNNDKNVTGIYFF
jgi:hypothetical protein